MHRFLSTAALLTLSTLAAAGDTVAVRIGIPRSAFRDVPPALLTFANQPFKDLIKAQTGIDGDVVNDAEAMNIAREMDAGKMQIGVFLGHEFAWARQKYPALEPIAIAVPKPREVQAFILVRHDSKATTLADLKTAKLVLAGGTRDHARLFLEKRQTDEMAGGTFCSMCKTVTVHDAIHKVIDGEADVTVADQASWNYFQRLYPGPAQNLKVLSKSEVFPASVIAYRKGSMTDAIVKKFREGLLTAHQTKKGANLMGTIKIEKFAAMPLGYEESLAEILKSYPAPRTDRAAVEK